MIAVSDELAALSAVFEPKTAIIDPTGPNFDQIFRTLVAALAQSNHPHAGPYTDGVLATQSQRLGNDQASRCRQPWVANAGCDTRVVVLDDAILGVGRQIIRQVVHAWLDVRRAEADRNSELVDLMAVSVTDSFHRRRLVRQLEDIGDQAAARLKPLCEHEFRRLPENEHLAALHALTDALATADLSDRALFDAAADPIKVALAVRRRVPKAAELLSEEAAAFYDALLDASCLALVRIVRELPAFQPRAMVELLGRMSQIADQLGDLSDRLPRTSLTAPSGTIHDDKFGNRYLRLIGDSLDDLELFGVDVRRYRLHTRVSVAYLSLTVSGKSGSGRARLRPVEDRWFDNRHDSDASMRIEAALAERPWTRRSGRAR